MDLLNNLFLGLTVAVSMQNLLYALLGCMVGTLIGVLPGIGPVATIAMLLPITFHLPPTASLIMLAGIYYGAQYGGSTTSILVNLPGEASSVVTCLDGYQMARKGRAGAALSISAVGSFFAGTVGTIIIVIFAEPLTRMAQKFGPADYCSLMALGLVAAVVLASGSVAKAIAMVFLGLLFGLHAGKEALQAPRGIRQGRGRGRGLAGVGEQRRGANLVHSHVDPRHPVPRGDGADGRRHDHP